MKIFFFGEHNYQSNECLSERTIKRKVLKVNILKFTLFLLIILFITACSGDDDVRDVAFLSKDELVQTTWNSSVSTNGELLSHYVFTFLSS